MIWVRSLRRLGDLNGPERLVSANKQLQASFAVAHFAEAGAFGAPRREPLDVRRHLSGWNTSRLFGRFLKSQSLSSASLGSSLRWDTAPEQAGPTGSGSRSMR